jgi:multidrug efflux system membrane fusion protein
VLFELDKRPLVAALEQAQANLQRDMAQAANAEVQATRLQQLVDRGIAPRDQGDTAKTSVVAMNATVEADRAAVENAKIQIQYATIPAPLTGRTGALMVHQGNLVRANDQIPLVTINEGRAHFGVVRDSRSASGRAQTLHGRRLADRHRNTAGQRPRVDGPHRLHR